MPRTLLAASLVAAVVLLAACSANENASSPPPSTAPSPSSAPTVEPTPTPQPSAEPTAEPSTPEPSDPAPTTEEQALIDGVRRGAIDCRPVREDLPEQAVAGIECASDDANVALIGFYRFADDRAMLEAYLARMAAEGVELDSGTCNRGDAEHAYTPGEGLVPYRNGCFINSAGFANYRATLPGSHLYIGILGRNADMAALESFAWLGNQDTPGNPTLWSGE